MGVLCFGLILGSSLIGTLSSIMTQYRIRFEDSSHKFMQLLRFLSQQEVNPVLAMTIKTHVMRRLKEKVRLKMEDVTYLEWTSKSSQSMVVFECRQTYFAAHVFLNAFWTRN